MTAVGGMDIGGGADPVDVPAGGAPVLEEARLDAAAQLRRELHTPHEGENEPDDPAHGA